MKKRRTVTIVLAMMIGVGASSGCALTGSGGPGINPIGIAIWGVKALIDADQKRKDKERRQQEFAALRAEQARKLAELRRELKRR